MSPRDKKSCRIETLKQRQERPEGGLQQFLEHHRGLSRGVQLPLIHIYYSSSHFNLGILILRAPRKLENFTLSRHCARWMDNIDGVIFT
jgi:hypothetical protein